MAGLILFFTSIAFLLWFDRRVEQGLLLTGRCCVCVCAVHARHR